MTNRELLKMANELDDRGECYALVTVVRAISPTSAYPGAQAIALGDGTLHGWIAERDPAEYAAIHASTQRAALSEAMS